MQALLGLMARTTVVLCPLLFILWAQSRTGSTWSHPAIPVDLTLLWIFWPRIRMLVQRGESATRAILQWTKGLISHSRKAYRTAQHIMRWMERIPFLMRWMEHMTDFLFMKERLLWSLLVAGAFSFYSVPASPKPLPP